MEFKDYYATLGVPREATADEVKRAYRKLARKYHPDVTKEADGEARFKEVAEAYEALSDPEKRAAYDAVGSGLRPGQNFDPPPGWDGGFEFSGRGASPGEAKDASEFFESLFGRQRGGVGARDMHPGGGDHHAKVMIDLEDAYRGARRTISLRVPVVDANGQAMLQDRQLDVNIPKGIREGQHLRLALQGAQGRAGAPAGDLYLEIVFKPSPYFRVDDRDVYLDLPVAPWEAALGASVAAPTPDGSVQLSIPPGSTSGRKLRLKGKGLPSNPAGDLYVVLNIAQPSADTPVAKDAYAALAAAFPTFNPRSALEAGR